MEPINVVQNVVKSGEEYLVCKRSKDGYWEFIGGKIEENESLKQAAIREVNEETSLELNKEDLQDFKRGDSYRTKDDKKFRLNPVYFKIDKKKKHSMNSEDLSNEHIEYEWIKLTDFDKYETLGQYTALENLGIINGRVALSAVKKNGKYLIVKRSSENSTPGKWGFVSGKIKSGETERQAAKRELEEETGLKAKPIEKGNYFIGKGEKGFWRIEPVKMKHNSGQIDLNWEISKFKWVKPEEITKFETIGDMKALKKLGLIRKWFSKKL